MKLPMITLWKSISVPVAPLFQGQGAMPPSFHRSPASLRLCCCLCNDLSTIGGSVEKLMSWLRIADLCQSFFILTSAWLEWDVAENEARKSAVSFPGYGQASKNVQSRFLWKKSYVSLEPHCLQAYVPSSHFWQWLQGHCDHLLKQQACAHW